MGGATFAGPTFAGATFAGATLAEATLATGTMLSSLALETAVCGAACLIESELESALTLCAALDAFGLRRGFASDDVRFPINHTPPTTAAIPAPTPRQIFGPIGGRSGFVWHHLHSPNCSG